MAGVSIVIPVFNQWHLTQDCLKSLATHTHGHNFEVLIIDNNSTDATPNQCKELGQNLFGNNFQYLRQEQNRNFGPASNIGAKAARNDLLFFLNNDTLVTPNWLPPLLETLQSLPRPGVVGPLLLYPSFAGFPNRVQHLGLSFLPQMFPIHLYEGFPQDHPVCHKKRFFKGLTGAALLMSRQLFLDSGGFDEAFINGGEDVELGLRMHAQGALFTCDSRSTIYHLVSQTPGRHDHEGHNGRLLRIKAFSLMTPDIQQFAAEDGYLIKLGPRLGLYLDVPQERQDALMQQYSASPSREQLHTLLLQEPCWYKGYELLTTRELQQKNPQEAAYSLYLSHRLRPDPITALKLKNTAILARDADLTYYAMLANALYMPGHFYQIETLAQKVCTHMQQLGQPDLQALFAEWLANKAYYKTFFSKEMVEASAALPPST